MNADLEPIIRQVTLLVYSRDLLVSRYGLGQSLKDELDWISLKGKFRRLGFVRL
jgi:hypothetical protein